MDENRLGRAKCWKPLKMAIKISVVRYACGKPANWSRVVSKALSPSSNSGRKSMSDNPYSTPIQPAKPGPGGAIHPMAPMNDAAGWITFLGWYLIIYIFRMHR